MKIKPILLLCFLSSTLMFSQEKQNQFSLQEAINYALENNKTIKNADLDILAAEQQVWETSSRGLPQINGAVNYNFNAVRAFDPEPGDVFGFIFPKHQVTPSVTLNQLIFDGGYIVGLQSNKVFLDISKNAKDKTVNTIETTVISAYNNALLTKESIGITKNNIKVLSDNLEETKKIFENGLTEEEDVEQLQLTLSSLENNLRSLETLSEISKGYLKILMGLEQSETIELTDSLESLVVENISLNLISDSHSVSNNIDYKIAANDAESKRLEYKLEKSEQLPKVNAFISSNYLGYSDSFSRFFTPEQDWLFTTVAGVKLSVPLFSSFGGRAKREQAKIAWDIAKNDLIIQKNTLLLDYKKAKSEYTLAIDDYSNKQKNLALAEKIERKNTIKFKEGLASSFDLRQAQLQLYTSQQEYLQAIINVINKKAALKTLLNTK